MEVATASSNQGGEKYVAPSKNNKRVEIGVGHLTVSDMAFSSKHSICIEDFVDKVEETNLKGSPRLRGKSWFPLHVSWGSGSIKLEVAVGIWLDLL
ncbi:unnamed protein product [Prunus armeniaca]